MSKLSAFIILLFCLVHVIAIFSTESLISGLVDIRGGKASSSKSKFKSGKARSRDDDDDDDDVVPAKPLRRTRARKRHDSRGRKRSKRSGPSFSDTLNALGKQGYAVAEDIFRRGKVLRSSNFESMLLKATWPSDVEVSADVINQLVKHSIPAFRYSRHDADSDSNPYYMTLHKLWMKMIERDWRTVLKSLYIQHSISRESGADHGRRFAAAIKDMSKTRNSKQPDHRYFDLKRLSGPQPSADDDEDASVSPLGEYEAVVLAYANYVLYRAKTFTSKFKEVKDLSETTKEKDAIAVLKKAQQMITLGLKCTTLATHRNPITGQVTKQVANDLKDLWKLYAAKIGPFLDSAAAGQYAEGGPSFAEDKAQLLKFYRDHSAEINTFLSTASKAFARLRIKIPTLTSEEAASLPTLEKVTSAVSALTGLRGGATPPSVQWMTKMVRDKLPRGRKAPVDEEEEDDDEDEEETVDSEEDDEEDSDEAEEEGDDDEPEEEDDNNDDDDEGETENDDDEDEED